MKFIDQTTPPPQKPIIPREQLLERLEKLPAGTVFSLIRDGAPTSTYVKSRQWYEEGGYSELYIYISQCSCLDYTYTVKQIIPLNHSYVKVIVRNNVTLTIGDNE
jgi:hypothetical protein